MAAPTPWVPPTTRTTLPASASEVSAVMRNLESALGMHLPENASQVPSSVVTGYAGDASPASGSTAAHDDPR